MRTAKRKFVVLSSVLALGLSVLAGAVYAAGLFPGLPAYTVITGSEVVPADTQLSGGRQPQTVGYTMSQIKGYRAYALTDGATIDVDASQGDYFTVTLGGNRTINTPTNLYDGQEFYMEVTQDATGSRSLTWGTIFHWGGATQAAPTLTTTGSNADLLRFVYNGNVLIGTQVVTNVTP